VWASSGKRAQRNSTCLALYGNTNPAKVSSVQQKIRRKKLEGDVFNNLNDLQWMEQQYYYYNKSIDEISAELNVSWSTVASAFKRLQIPTKPSPLSSAILTYLNDAEWLKEQHHIQKKSLRTIATELNVSEQTIYAYFTKFDIEVKVFGALSNDVRNSIDDKDWLYDQYVTKKKTFGEIARDLNISSATVAAYCKKHNIENQHYVHKISGDVFLKLNNKEWLLDQHHTQQKSLSQMAKELGFGFDMTTVMNYIHKYDIPILQHRHSQGEKEIVQFLKNAGVVNVYENIKSIIHPQELDIYLPDYKLAIEYCGLYWHGEKFKNRLYHRNKLRACNTLGIRLLTIYENEWLSQQDLVKQKLLSILKLNKCETVFARKCVVVVLNKKQKKQFFDKYHIQQNGPGSVSYGLVYNNNIIAAITFIKTKNGEYILNRYATACNVPGGFSKLLEYFKKNNNWTRIITFADLRWSEGNLYDQSKFTLDIILQPEYQYIIKNTTIHKFNFRRKYLPTKLKTFDPLLSEWENCKMNNIDRIWDCGKKRYIQENL
jgi:AraC-like DNA-binding protein